MTLDLRGAVCIMISVRITIGLLKRGPVVGLATLIGLEFQMYFN